MRLRFIWLIGALGLGGACLGDGWEGEVVNLTGTNCTVGADVFPPGRTPVAWVTNSVGGVSWSADSSWVRVQVDSAGVAVVSEGPGFWWGLWRGMAFGAVVVFFGVGWRAMRFGVREGAADILD